MLVKKWKRDFAKLRGVNYFATQKINLMNKWLKFFRFGKALSALAHFRIISSPILYCGSAEVFCNGIEVSGWALSPEGIEKVELYLNGSFLGIARYGLSRPDVQVAYPRVTDSINSGYTALVFYDQEKEVCEQQKLTVRAIDKAGRCSSLTLQIQSYHESYQNYMRSVVPSDRMTLWMKAQSSRFLYKPTISFFVLADKETIPYIDTTIESIRVQCYPYWGIYVVLGDDLALSECKNQVKSNIEGIVFLSLQSLCELQDDVSGDFSAVIISGDKLTPEALFEAVTTINLDRVIDFLYGDEDREQENVRMYPFFKPDWSPDLLFSTNYIGHFFLIKKILWYKVNNCLRTFTPEGIYDFVLHITGQAQNISHVSKILYTRGSFAELTSVNRKKVLEAALKRRQINADVTACADGSHTRIKRKILNNPLVSIIIPTAYNNPDLLESCLSSIVKKSTYKKFELIILDHSFGRLSSQYLRNIVSASIPLKIIPYNQTFNYSRMNNMGASEAVGEYLLFLNDDIEVISPDWIEELLGHGQRPDVGVVGAKLLYPDDTLQHGGVFLVDYPGGVRHAFYCFPNKQMSYFDFTHLTRNCSAVTFACVMVSKDIFSRLGGLDENLNVEYNDIDFCLRASKAGYLIVWTPFAVLYHKESASRGRLQNENDRQIFWSRWHTILKQGDPYYNRNLSLDSFNGTINVRPLLVEHLKLEFVRGKVIPGVGWNSSSPALTVGTILDMIQGIRIKRFLQNRSSTQFVLGIQPMASDPKHRWPLAYYAQLADIFAARNTARIIIFGEGMPSAAISAFMNEVKAGGCETVLSGRLSDEQNLTKIMECNLFVSNNNGHAQIASILNIPTVLITCCQGLLENEYPLGDLTINVRLGINAKQLDRVNTLGCPCGGACLRFLWPEKVWETAQRLLVFSGE